MPVPNPGAPEAEFEAFHNEIKEKLIKAEDALACSARFHQQEADADRERARKLRIAANASNWWELCDFLTQQEINSLCECDPIQLLD